MLVAFLATMLTGATQVPQYDYSLVDINPNSATSGQTLSPSSFPGEVTLHYFGHQS